jgi:hypothetical protein
VACLSGRVYFRGNDRSADDRATDVGRTVSDVLKQVLPEVYDRFKEVAAKPNEVKKGTDALFTAENLQGLPSVFTALGLLRDEKGKAAFRVESGPLKEVLDRIEARANYGDTASGKYLENEFDREPFGWDFEVVRLLVLSLLRSGAIEATSKGQTIDSVSGVEAREAFSNNNVFRQASFRPKKGIEFGEIVKAAEAFKDTFGSEIRELTASALVVQLRNEVARNEDVVASSFAMLTAHRLPGGSVLEGSLGHMKAILRGTEDNAIATFNASHKAIKEAIKRALELAQVLSEPRLRDLERARRARGTLWPFLAQESDISQDLRTRADGLTDLLDRETFFKELPQIEQAAKALEDEYARRFAEALDARVDAYTRALDTLFRTPGWGALDEDQQRSLSVALERGLERDDLSVPIPQLRADRDACESRLRSAIADLRRIIDGERVVSISLGSYFGGGVETEEQLDAALAGVREECARLIGSGKKVVVQ